MAIHIHGVINGKHIELEQELGLPPGSHVLVTIEPKALTLEEKRQLVDELAGAWKDDPSLGPIFEEIERERAAISFRDVSFDATS